MEHLLHFCLTPVPATPCASATASPGPGHSPCHPPPRRCLCLSTFILELHKAKHDVWVDLLLWRPCHEDLDPAHWPANMPQCRPVPLKMGDCPEHCPYDRWKALIHRRLERTGDFEKLCTLPAQRLAQESSDGERAKACKTA